MSDKSWMWMSLVLWLLMLACVVVGSAQIAWVPAGLAGFAMGVWDERRNRLVGERR
jgi:hypothetical protein